MYRNVQNIVTCNAAMNGVKTLIFTLICTSVHLGECTITVHLGECTSRAVYISGKVHHSK